MAEDGYSEDETARLELIWGEGFLSPGGAGEVARVLGTHEVGGCAVLDVGSGAGGAALCLARDHGARSVVGADVQHELVERAAALAAAAGLDDRVSFVLVEPGPLPFPDASFDVVFSKDAIIHVADKRALYSEIHRVLRPGGLLLVSDWLRGAGDELTAQVDRLVEAAGHGFTMATLREIALIVECTGFVDVETEDRRVWYLAEATEELCRLEGEMRQPFATRFGEDAMEAEIGFWRVLVDCLTTGALSPGHVRARKPERPAPVPSPR